MEIPTRVGPDSDADRTYCYRGEEELTLNESERKIVDALIQLTLDDKLPMEAGRLVEEMVDLTGLSQSTIYRYQKLWRERSRAQHTSLDKDLERAYTDQRFLISIRIPADLLRWSKAEGEKRGIGYQSFIVSLIYWLKDSPLTPDSN